MHSLFIVLTINYNCSWMIPLVLVVSSQTSCSSLSSSPSSTTTIGYCTRGMYTYEDYKATEFFDRGVVKAKLVWQLRGYWETVLRINVASRKIYSGKDVDLSRKLAELIVNIVKEYGISDYPLGFECREHQLWVFVKNDEEENECIQAMANSYHAFAAANRCFEGSCATDTWPTQISDGCQYAVVPLVSQLSCRFMCRREKKEPVL